MNNFTEDSLLDLGPLEDLAPANRSYISTYFFSFVASSVVYLVVILFTLISSQTLGSRLCYLFIYTGSLCFVDSLHLIWGFFRALEMSDRNLLHGFGCYFSKISECLSHTLPFHIVTALCFEISGIYTPVPLVGKYMRASLSIFFIAFVSFIINCQYLISVQYSEAAGQREFTCKYSNYAARTAYQSVDENLFYLYIFWAR